MMPEEVQQKMVWEDTKEGTVSGNARTQNCTYFVVSYNELQDVKELLY
jgi:hypothetical protein